MTYPQLHNLNAALETIHHYAHLKYEYGAKGVQPLLNKAERLCYDIIVALKSLPEDPEATQHEPNDLASIHALRPDGPRRLWTVADPAFYTGWVEGSLLGRFAGCTLGVPVEGWSIERMQAWSTKDSEAFPPIDYWKTVSDPEALQYGTTPRKLYSRAGLDGVPVDDDLTYTQLGLLIMETYGPKFTTQHVAEAWLKLLPMACTAEDIALCHLKNGVSPLEAGAIENPYQQWIGAGIRADAWGYMAPGWPELAAEFAWRDAMLSHRRNGIYLEMFWAAAISAAFSLDHPIEAVEAGLTEIPAECELAKQIRWALSTAPEIKNYYDAHMAVTSRFSGMHPIHALNNACLTVFGLAIGGTDFTKVISETVAMGLDNDCNAATAGSLVGAILGAKHIPPHWTRRFNNKVYTYLNEHRGFQISDLVRRFAYQAQLIHQTYGI